MAQAELKARLSLNSGSFAEGLKRAQAAAVSFGKTVAGISVSIAGLGAAITALGVKNVLDLGGKLSDLSDRTGVNVKDLMILQKAFEDAGIGADSVGSSINRMQKFIAEAADGTSSAVEAMSNLGLSLKDLENLNPSDQFKAVSDAISNIENPARRAQVAMAIFGKSAGSMMSLFKNPEALNQAAKTIGRQADIMQKNAATFDRASDLLGSIYLKVQGFFAGIADKIAPALLEVLEMLDSIDLAQMGQDLGDSIMDAASILYNAFASDKLGELVYSGLVVGFQEGINYLVSAMKFAVDFISNALDQIFSFAPATLADNIVDFVGAAIISLGSLINSVFLKAFQTPIIYFQAAIQKAAEEFMELLKKIPGTRGGRAFGLEGFKASSFEDIKKNTEASLAGFTSEDFSAQASLFGGVAKDAIIAAGKNVSGIWENTKLEKANLFGDESKKALADLTESLRGQGLNIKERRLETNIAGVAGESIGGKLNLKGVGAVSSSLASVGGGGGFAAGGIVQVAQKQLNEQKTTNNLLMKMYSKMGESDYNPVME